MSQEVQYQEPLVHRGTTFDISGKKAVVEQITATGVLCRVEGEKRMHTIDFGMIERAIANQG